MGRTLQTIPFHEFHFYLVPFIPYSAIDKIILLRSLIIHSFTRVENQPLKQRLKRKRNKNLQYFSHCKDDMKIIQLFCRFPLKSQNISTLHKINAPQLFFCSVYQRKEWDSIIQKKIIYFYKTNMFLIAKRMRKYYVIILK